MIIFLTQIKFLDARTLSNANIDNIFYSNFYFQIFRCSLLFNPSFKSIELHLLYIIILLLLLVAIQSSYIFDGTLNLCYQMQILIIFLTQIFIFKFLDALYTLSNTIFINAKFAVKLGALPILQECPKYVVS